VTTRLYAHHRPRRRRPLRRHLQHRRRHPPYAVFVVKVADVAATATRAEELGGKVVVAPNKLEDGMVIAYLTDPDGSLFALFSPAPEG
jgi:predicted enzyme related to lactoylglutathione lyase